MLDDRLPGPCINGLGIAIFVDAARWLSGGCMVC